jgi:hypothetical protein
VRTSNPTKEITGHKAPSETENGRKEVMKRERRKDKKERERNKDGWMEVRANV